ncbi:MAG: metallophosphoesterase [Verrucomicrobia bacterium]|nr:metallophosphoesterase [Verrucomicrobiota bacterium]MCH8527007.1 metallophosphoesterase [Kiritimatiellia bacterium]
MTHSQTRTHGNLTPARLTALAVFAAVSLLSRHRADASSFEAFRADRLLLTWQRDPATTMTIQWLSEGHTNPPVEDVSAEDESPQALPYVGPVRVDGSGGWADRGLAVPYLVNHNRHVPDPEVFMARARLGWNEQGVVVLADVRARERFEQDETNRLVHGDSLSVYIMDGNARLQVVASPGGLADQPEARYTFHDTGGRVADADDLEVELAARHANEGKIYRIEMLVPWSNLNRTDVEAGMDLHLQLHVINHDGPRGNLDRDWAAMNAGHLRHPQYSHREHQAVAFRLAPRDAAVPPPMQTRTSVDAPGDAVRVQVEAGGELLGRTVNLYSGRTRVASGGFTPWRHQTRATINVPAPPEGHRWGTMETRLDDGTPLGVVTIPQWYMQRPPEPVQVRYWKTGSDEHRTAVTRVKQVAQWQRKFTQRVELTGLEPDTEYRFQVEGYDDYGFRTMPATLDEPIRLAIGGDTRHSQQSMERTSRMVMEHNPRAIIWGGDLAYANGVASNLYRWREWFDANHNTLIDERRVVTPIVVAIGNHEMRSGYYFRHSDYAPTDEWRESVAPYFYSLFAFPGHPGYNVLDFGDYLSLIILDSDHTAPVGGEQTRWLERVLAERQHVRHLFPVYHVTAYPSARDFNDRTSAAVRRHWVPLFEEYGVRLAFENHDHTYKRTHPIRNGEVVSPEEGVVYIGDGAWGVGLRRVHNVEETWYLKEAQSILHAFIVTLHPTHVEVKVHSANGDLIDEVDITVSP